MKIVRTAPAFTLLEVLLGIGLLSLVAALLMSFIWNLADRREAMLRVAHDLRSGNALLDGIERDLLAGIAGDASAGAGVRGTTTRLRLLTRGVWVPRSLPFDGEGDGEGETWGEVAPVPAADEGRGDLQGSEYIFDAGSGRIMARRWSGGQNASGEFEVLSENVARVRFRYFDGREWLDSFDSLAADALPVAIEVALWYGTPPEGAEVEPAAGADAPEPREGTAGGADRGARDAGNSWGMWGGWGGWEEEQLQDQRLGNEGARAGVPTLGITWWEPDRLRVIIVPDGPTAAWGAMR